MRILYPFIFITLFTLHACSSSKKPVDGKIVANENGETVLGKSLLYIILPQNLEMYEVHGEQGYVAYNIFSKNTDDNITGEMIIWNGHPIVSGYEESKIKIDSVSSKILDKQILWTIYKTGKGLFATANNQYGFFAWTKERKDLDRMIDVFATLNLKKK